MRYFFIPLVIFFICLNFLNACAQVTIKGSVTDSREGLPSAHVMLLNPDSSLYKGTVTSITGEFVLERILPGNYLISTTMIGYSAFRSSIIVSAMDIDLPEITLSESSTTLGEVVVKAEKPLLEQRIDRLIVNVQNSVTAAGNTALELLQKAPGVVINRQSNSISMNGRAGVRVMIDGKVMQMPIDAVMQMLDGMNSSNIERIELITSPPAKYDAEGNAGIIQIITKSETDVGTSGSIGVTAGAHWAETVGTNFSLNHRSKKWAYEIDYSILRNHNQHIYRVDQQSVTDLFTQTISAHSPRENLTTQQNLNGSFEYRLSERTTATLSFTGSNRNWVMHSRSTENNQLAQDLSQVTDMRVYESNIWQSAMGSSGITTRLGSKSELAFHADYLYYRNDNPSNYDNVSMSQPSGESREEKIDLQKTTPIHFYIARADHTYTPSSTLTFESGIKGVVSGLHNDVLVQRFQDDQWKVDPAFTSFSTLKEQIGAGYVAAQWKPSESLQWNGGVRYEYTHTLISTPTEPVLVERKYGYFFPTLSFRKNFAAESDIQLSYARRLTRPTFNDMAPFVFFWGPGTFSSGNTQLRPAVADAVKVGYHLKQWILGLQFSHSGREIVSWQPERNNNSDVLYRAENLKYLNTWSLTNSYTAPVTSWWEVQSNIITQYQVAVTNHLAINTSLSLFGVNASITNVFRMRNDFAAEISANYQSTSLQGTARYLPMGYLNAGIQKKFGGNGTLKLAMDDILNTLYWRISTNIPQDNLYTYFYYNFHNRFIRLTYTWNLGNKKLKMLKVRSGSEEERNRVN